MNRSHNNPELSNSSISAEPPLVNPELEGGDFFWQGGADGVLLLHGLTATTAEVRHWPSVFMMKDSLFQQSCSRDTEQLLKS